MFGDVCQKFICFKNASILVRVFMHILTNLKYTDAYLCIFMHIYAYFWRFKNMHAYSYLSIRLNMNMYVGYVFMQKYAHAHAIGTQF